MVGEVLPEELVAVPERGVGVVGGQSYHHQRHAITMDPFLTRNK